MRIRYGYGTDTVRHDTRYDTLARDDNGSPPPDRVREPIKWAVSLALNAAKFVQLC